MAKAALDVLSVLPAPAIKQNNGCSDLLEDQLFAYGSGCSIVVLEVQQLRMQLVLHGEHRESLVTAIKWAPDCHSRDLKTSSHLRLASGDSDGRVVVWDVLGNEALVRLSDRSSDNGIASSGSGVIGSGTCVVGLSWVVGQPWLLAVLMAQGNLVLWDTRGGNMVWQRELFQNETCCCLSRDPLDARRLAVCSAAGGLCLIKLTDPQAGTVDVVQYRISAPQAGAPTSSSGAAGPSSGSPVVCQALFSPARDVLFLALPREMIVFDLELGLPAASMTLAGSKPAFAGLLGVYGASVSHGLGTEGGTSLIYAAHVDGSLSAWIRSPGELRFVNAGWFRLTPPSVRGATNPITLLAAKAQVWPSRVSNAAGVQDAHVGVACSEDLTRALRGSLLPDRVAPDASGSRDIFGGVVNNGGNNNRSAAGNGGASQVHSSDSYVSLISVTSDGRVWKWQAILPPFQQRAPTAIALAHLTTTSTQPPPPPPIAPPPPNLSAMSQLLPGPLTCIGVFPRPILLTDLSPHTSLITTASISTTSSTAFEASSPFYKPQSAKTSPVWEQAKQRGAGHEAKCDASGVPVGEVGLLGAGLTISGQLQVFTIQRGQASPLSFHLCLSLSVHKEGGAARGLRWLGRTPRVLTFTCDRVAPAGQGQGQAGQAAPAWHNSMVVTDLRTRRTTPFREIVSEPNRLAGVRTSPSGFHVLLIFRNAPTELWAVGVDPPIKLMSLDVAWSAPEWISSSDPTNPTPLRLGDLLDVTNMTSGTQEPWVGMASPLQSHLPQADSMVIDSSSKAMWGAGGGSLITQSSVLGRPSGTSRFPTLNVSVEPLPASDAPPPPPPYKNPSNTWQATVNEVTAKAPAEYIAYTYDEGIKSGVLRVQGRHVINDDRVKRPRLPAEEPQNFDATAMCGWGSVVVMGDAEGRLAVWSTATGATSLIHTGYGLIRRVYVAPAPHPSLYTAPEKVAAIAARVACLFGDGTIGVYELGPRGQLRPGHMSPLITSRMFGRANDICWLPLPCEGGGGSVLLALNDTGSIVALDVSQAADRRPSRTHRTYMMRTILSTPSRLQPVTTSPQPLKQSGPSRLSRSAMPVIDDMLGDEVPMSPVSPEASYQQIVQQGAFKIVLAAPPPLSCSLLLPRSWALLLRLLLQLGMSEHTLQALARLSLPTHGSAAEASQQSSLAQSPKAASEQGSTAGVWEVVEELMTLLPTATHKALQHALSKQQQAPDSAGGATTPADESFQFTTGKPADSRHTSSAGAQSEIEELPEAGPSINGAIAIKAPTEVVQNGDQSTGTTLMRAVGDAFKMVRDTTQNLIDDYMTPGSTTPPGTPRAGKTAIDDPAAHGKHLHSSFHHDLLGLLQHLAQCRAGGQLLTDTEWANYRAALACSVNSGSGKLATALIAHALGTAPPPSSPRLTQPLAFSATAAATAGSSAVGSTAARVARLCACCAAAAQVSGDREEAAFWTHLPATLQAVRDLQDSLAPPSATLYQAPPVGSFPTAPGHALAVQPAEPLPPLRVAYHPAGPASTKPPVSSPRNGDVTHADVTQPDSGATRLWDEDTTLAEAQERTLWHESLSRITSAGSEELQERRLLEYVVLGDLQTAVAFLLASTPEACVRYYRDALITAALAAAANMRPGTGVRQLGSALQLQAAKVLSAHAASIGDPLMGVPLHCAAGLYAEAVGLLQECGMWRAAATLTAHALVGAERGQALQRWAEHVAHNEGSVWRAAGILVAAGCCREALKLLQGHGRPDSAAAFLAACHTAGLTRTTTTTSVSPNAVGPTSTSVTKPAGTATDLPPPQVAGEVEQQQQQQRLETDALKTRLSATSLVQPDSSRSGSLAPRLSLSKGDILQQQVVSVQEGHMVQTSAQSGTSGLGRSGSDTEALLSRTLSTGWASSTCVRVFSVLSISQGGQEPAIAGSQQDDAGPVQLQFERFVTDLLQHM